MPLLYDPDEDIQVALLRVLVPELLHGDRLVRFLSKGGGAFFANALETVGKRISVPDLDATLLAARSDHRRMGIRGRASRCASIVLERFD
jgi:hypothetical protein